MTALLGVLALAALVVVPGVALLAALRARTTRPADPLAGLGMAVAASLAILVVVGSLLGHLGIYRFFKTGFPVVELALAALVAFLYLLATGRLRSPRAPAEPAGRDA